MFKNAKFDINNQGIDYFVGDLHGCYNEFQNKLKKINFNPELDRIFSVGDLVDRGLDSVRCLGLLMQPWFHAVKGNHEDFMLGSHSAAVWAMNGGDWAWKYGEDDLQFFQDLVCKKMHRTMTIQTKHGTIGVVHAESAGDWNHNGDHTDEQNSWARTKIRSKDDSIIKNVDRVVVGHTVLKDTYRLGNVVYIDTGAVFDSGFLTILSADEIFNM